MIAAARAGQIEEVLADLIGCGPDEVRDYLRGYIKADASRRTGFRFVRGSHSGHYVLDPEGVDELPASYSIPVE